MDRYEVVVGNIGTTYSGDKLGLAIKDFADYHRASVNGIGRGAGESVAMFADGEIVREWRPEEGYFDWI